MAEYREILAKTVVGRGRKNVISNHSFTCENEISKTLGCWIINHQYEPYIINDNLVRIEGSFDVHIWYSYNKDLETGLVKRTINYKEDVDFKMKPGERLGLNNELKGFMIKYPSCISMNLTGNEIEIKVEKDFVIDAIGETKIKVQISKNANEEWLLDEEIDTSINTNYIIEGKNVENNMN